MLAASVVAGLSLERVFWLSLNRPDPFPETRRDARKRADFRSAVRKAAVAMDAPSPEKASFICS
jgi:hypothetical protein